MSVSPIGTDQSTSSQSSYATWRRDKIQKGGTEFRRNFIDWRTLMGAQRTSTNSQRIESQSLTRLFCFMTSVSRFPLFSGGENAKERERERERERKRRRSTGRVGSSRVMEHAGVGYLAAPATKSRDITGIVFTISRNTHHRHDTTPCQNIPRSSGLVTADFRLLFVAGRSSCMPRHGG